VTVQKQWGQTPLIGSDPMMGIAVFADCWRGYYR
jgi:hypothetical protein